MAHPALIATMPADLDIGANFTIRLDAIDPTSGATIANVAISDAIIAGSGMGVGNAATVGPFLLVPGPKT